MVKLHGTCPGLHFREEGLFRKKIFHSEFQTPSGKFWQGNQNCLLRVQGICWSKRVVLKRFFCSFFRTFSIGFLDLRQTFSQVVRTVKNLSRVVLEDFFFGDMAQYLYISTWLFNKKFFFFALFLGMIVKSALYVSKGTILDSFGCCENSTFCDKFWGETKKLSNFGQDFQRSCKTTFHVTRGKSCGYRFFRKNYKIPLRSKLEGK